MVAVGVAVAAVLKAMPVRLAICVGTLAVIDERQPARLAGSLRFVSVIGLNVTETWQLELAGTEPSQLSEVIA